MDIKLQAYRLKREKCYTTTLSQQILSDRLLLAVFGGQKSNFSDGFKLKPVTTYHL